MNYEERFIEEYTSCDKEIEMLKEKIKKYKQMMDTLKQEDIKNVLDDTLKSEASVIITCLKNDEGKIDDLTKKLIKQLSSETIYNELNRKIYDIENYNISGREKYKMTLLQIKHLGLIKKYFDSIDIESKIGFFKCKSSSYTIFKSLINAYKDTDYISELKDIMNEEFYTKCLNAKIIFIEQYSMEPFGLSLTFDNSDWYEIIPESMRINNLEDVKQLNINGHWLYSNEDMKNIGEYIKKGHNKINLALKTMPNKINRSIVYLAKVN